TAAARVSSSSVRPLRVSFRSARAVWMRARNSALFMCPPLVDPVSRRVLAAAHLTTIALTVCLRLHAESQRHPPDGRMAGRTRDGAADARLHHPLYSLRSLRSFIHYIPSGRFFTCNGAATSDSPDLTSRRQRTWDTMGVADTRRNQRVASD